MRVVTFNIHHGTVGLTGPVDVEQLAEVCGSFDADVIALQEVDQGTYRSGRLDLAAEVARRLDMGHVFGFASRFWGGRYGNALLARGEIVSSSVVSLPRFPGWHLWQERRSLIHAEVRSAGEPWRLVVTHLAVPPRVNAQQLEHLLGVVDPGSVVLGDFNSLPDAVRPLAEAAGHTYVEHGPTYEAGEPKVAIDHLLLPPGVAAIDVEVRSTPMSDHAALIVDLTREDT